MTEQATATAAGTRAACLDRLAAALAGYQDLEVKVRADGSVPYLAVRNTAIPYMSETVAVTESGDVPAYMWSWGARIGDTGSPDAAARVIAYVLAVPGVRLDPRRPGGAAVASAGAG